MGGDYQRARGRHKPSACGSSESVGSLTMARDLNLALIPGDGIGTEVVAEAMKVLDAVAPKAGINVSTTQYDLRNPLQRHRRAALGCCHRGNCELVTPYCSGL